MIRMAFALIALMVAAPGLPQQRDSLSEAEKAVCTAKGGMVDRVGKAQTEVCHERTTDAGKTCTTLNQCQSYMCEVDVRTLSDDQYRGKAPVVGKCTGWTHGVFGCHDIVMDGRYRGRCVD